MTEWTEQDEKDLVEYEKTISEGEFVRQYSGRFALGFVALAIIFVIILFSAI